MKKILFISLLYIALIGSIFGYSGNFTSDLIYLVPMGSSGIDLRSIMYPRRTTEKLTWGGKVFPSPLPDPKEEGFVTTFYDQNIIVLGGVVSNIIGSTQSAAINLEKTFFRFSVYTDTGSMDLVSQSNNSYRRPFELYLAVSQNDSAIVNNDSNKIKQQIVKIDSVNMSHESALWNDTKINTDIIANDGDVSFTFDILLALPGQFEENTTVLEVDNKLYMLGEADDYAAMVTIKAELIGVDNNGSETVLLTKTLTVPFTGFINTDSDYKDESNVSLVVSQEAISSIIDIKSNQNKPFRLATLDFMANLGTSLSDEASFAENFAIFISSNSNPHIKGNKFRFENVNSTGGYNSYNSVGFTLELVGTNQRAKFYGDEYLQGNEIISSDPNVIPYVRAINNPYEDSRILHSHGGNYKWDKYYYYEGELIMTLDSIPNVFAAGRYTENIYIHVISDYQKK